MEIPLEQQAPPASAQARDLASSGRRVATLPVLLLGTLVGMLALVNYIGWIRSYFVADDWTLIGSVTQADWTPLDLLPWRFWDLNHEINPLRYYSPVLLILTWLPVKFGGYSPELYHLSVILPHVGTTVFLFLATLQLTESRLKAVVAGSIFAVHFGATEAVGWFAANSHPIVGFFESMSLVLYATYLRTRRPLWWYAALVPLVAASLTQASALVWFVVLACLDVIYTDNRRDYRPILRRFLILGAILAGIFLLQFQALFMGRGGYKYSVGPWALLNLFYYPVSTVIPSLEENAVSLYRDLFQATSDWSAFARLMGMREAFNILLAAALVVVAAVLLWMRGGRIGRLSVIGFALGLAPFLLLNGQGYRYVYTPLMFFSLAAAETVGNAYRSLRRSSTVSALVLLAIVPIFVVLSFAESQRQLFWWDQAGIVSHNSLQELKQLQPNFPSGVKIIFGGLPDTLQHTNAEVWRRGIQEAVRAIYNDRTLMVESYGKEEVERQFREELKGAPATYGFVWEAWHFRALQR